MILLFPAAVVLPWLVIAFLLASPSAISRNSTSWRAVVVAREADASTQAVGPANPPPSQWTPGKKGPWGRIESRLFAIDLPDEYAFFPSAEQPPIRWSFPGYSKERVLATLRSVGLPEGEVKKLESSAKWTSEGGVAAVEPGDRLILSLTPEVRAKLYAILVAFPQNGRQIDPIWFRDGGVDWRLQGGGLAPESLALVKRLLYPQGDNMLLFADFEPAARGLPNDAERRLFMKTVSRKQAVLAHVRLDRDADVEKIAQYWGLGGRRKIFFLFSARSIEWKTAG